MSHPLTELRRLLTEKAVSSRGVVVSVKGSKAKVRTSSGINTYQSNGLRLASGNEVYISGGGVVSVVVSAAETPVYDI